MNNLFKNKKFKYGSISTVVTIGFIVIVTLINIIIGLIFEKFPLDIDLTKDSVFKLTSQSIDFVKNLNKNINVDILADKSSFDNANDYYAQASKVIELYAKYSDKINISYTDIYKNPNIASKYSDLGVVYGDIVVSSDDRQKKISAYNLFNISQSQYGEYISSSKAEQAMTSALVYVTDVSPVKVSLLTGQSESDISGYISVLKSNNYEVVTQNILTDQIDSATSMLIIAAPEKDYSEEQLAKIDAFLENSGQYGKTVVYVASMQQKSLPNLEGFLSSWGVKINDSVIFETDAKKVYLSPFFLIQQLGYKDIFPNYDKLQTIIMPNARQISTIFESSGNIYVDNLLQTSDTSALRPVELPDNWKVDNAEKGVFTTATISRKVVGDTGQTKQSNVVVFASPEFFNSDILLSTSIGNADYLVTLTNNLLGKESNVQIVDKQLEGFSLGMSMQDINILTATFLFALPVFVIILGLFVWLRRRNL